MKFLRIAGFVVGLLALIYYAYQLFGNPNGKKYTYDKKHHVYYKGDGVTEDDAKKVAEYFKQSGVYNDVQDMDVQINADKNSNEIKIKYIADKDKVTQELETDLKTFSAAMGANLFPGKHIHVILTDDHLDDIKDLGVATSDQSQQNNTNTQQ